MRAAIPQPRRYWVPRPRIIEAMLHWRELGLIEVVARAGYGKTTLAGMLLHALSALPDAERPAALWISLDANDGARNAFLRRLDEALQPHFPALAEAFALERSGEFTEHQLINACRRTFEHWPGPLLLVIDDCHLLLGNAHAIVQQLLDAAPENLHLLLLSRTPLALHISRRTLDRQLFRLNEEDLRLDHDEFERFVRASSLANLTPAQRKDLEQHSDGWILGLQMIAAAPRARSLALPALAHSALLAHFFDADVLAPLPLHVRRFLVDVAVLPFLTIDLAATAAGISTNDCAALLQDAAIANVFVTAFSSDGEESTGYRLHPLFREHLLRQPEAGAADVRRRAAAWLAEHEEVDAALNLLLPHLVQEAASVVATAGRRALLKHKLADARRWMALLPAEIIAASPRLALDSAWLCLFSEGGDLRAQVSRAQAAVAAVPDAPAELLGDANVLHAWCLFLEGCADDARSAVAVASQCLGDAPSIPAAYLHVLHALATPAADDLYSRIASLQRSAEVFRQVGYEHGAAVATSGLAALKLRYGDPAGALVSFEYALGILTNIHFSRGSLASEMRINYAEILLFMGRFDTARREFAQAAEFSQVTTYYPRMFVHLCDLYQHGAADVDDDADAAAWASLAASANPVMLAIAGVVRILRDHRLGRPERCWQTVESLGIFPHQLTPDMPDPIAFAVLAGAVLSGRSIPNLTNALQRACEQLAAAHNHWLSLRLRILQAIDFVHQANLPAATALLQTLQPDVDALRMPMLLTPFDELRPLLTAPRPTAAATPTDFGLSQQEIRVLRLLATGRPTEDIATELYISRETVRTHLRRCFRKLGAHNRVEAVKAAREARVI